MMMGMDVGRRAVYTYSVTWILFDYVIIIYITLTPTTVRVVVSSKNTFEEHDIIVYYSWYFIKERTERKLSGWAKIQLSQLANSNNYILQRNCFQVSIIQTLL